MKGAGRAERGSGAKARHLVTHRRCVLARKRACLIRAVYELDSPWFALFRAAQSWFFLNLLGRKHLIDCIAPASFTHSHNHTPRVNRRVACFRVPATFSCFAWVLIGRESMAPSTFRCYQ